MGANRMWGGNGTRACLCPPLLQFWALAVGAVEMVRVYLYTGAFLLGGPPACWENGSRIYLYVRYPFVALAVGRVEIRGASG